MNKHRQSWTETDIVDGNFDGNDIAGLVRSPGIVILTESHDIHTLRTQSGTHRRRRSGLAGLKCQLYHSDHCKMQRPINGRKELKNCAENAVRIELNWIECEITFLGFAAGFGFRGSHCGDAESPPGLELEGHFGAGREAAYAYGWAPQRRRE